MALRGRGRWSRSLLLGEMIQDVLAMRGTWGLTVFVVCQLDVARAPGGRRRRERAGGRISVRTLCAVTDVRHRRQLAVVVVWRQVFQFLRHDEGCMWMWVWWVEPLCFEQCGPSLQIQCSDAWHERWATCLRPSEVADGGFKLNNIERHNRSCTRWTILDRSLL